MATATTYPKELGRFRCSDTLGVGSARDGHVIGWARPAAARVRDQDPEQESEGELICRLMEGRDGNWAGHDARGRVLRIKRGRDGALEIRHAAEEASADEADPAVVGMSPATGKDPATAATGDNALSAWSKTGSPQFHLGALAEYQKKLDEHYAR
jgi:hypothetical protein